MSLYKRQRRGINYGAKSPHGCDAMEIEVEENFGWICGAILKKQHDENKRYAELSMDGFRAQNKKARTAVMQCGLKFYVVISRI